MDKFRRIIFHGWFVPTLGAVIFAAALIGLWFPVYLGAYDKWGIEIGCGNGYSSHLAQAASVDQDQSDQAAGSYVEQCSDAVGHRQAWLLPTAGIGAGIVGAEVMAWVRRRGSDGSGGGGWRQRPDTALHDAAVLDRRFGSHEPPQHTTW